MFSGASQLKIVADNEPILRPLTLKTVLRLSCSAVASEQLYHLTSAGVDTPFATLSQYYTNQIKSIFITKLYPYRIQGRPIYIPTFISCLLQKSSQIHCSRQRKLHIHHRARSFRLITARTSVSFRQTDHRHVTHLGTFKYYGKCNYQGK